MIKTYQNYLIKLFFKKISITSLVFLCLIIILNIFEEINFFKNLEINFLLPFFISLLRAPSNLFEVFPFIFLISTQFFFLDIMSKNELETLKIHGLYNLKIIKLLFFSSFLLSVFLVIIFYSISAKLNFLYLDIKNKYSDDNKYLAVVTKNGLWIKDEILEKTYIINSAAIENNFLKDVVISKFDKNFNLESVIQSSKVDISNFEWVVYQPIISTDNKRIKHKKNIYIKLHFDQKKINSLYRNLSSLTPFQLLKLKKDYESIGYSTNDILLQLHKLASFPFYLTILTILMSIIMLNTKRNKPVIYHIILGVFISVLIYYFYYLFNLFGKNNTIPILTSIWLPLLILIIFIMMGLIRVNEK
jgi:lipopolysaccharide export system permease protein